MGQFGGMIADAATVSQRYANRLATGIPPERFGRLARPSGKTIASNHPAFVLGHLCLYPVKVMQLLDQDTTAVEPPMGYETLFSKEAVCQDDSAGTLYPSCHEIMDFFTTSYQHALDALRAASDEKLAGENPIDSPLKQVCPTLGSVLAFYMTGHVAMHLGQLSSWRRMEGLPPA